LRASEYYLAHRYVKKIRLQEWNVSAIQKIVLDLTANREYMYKPDIGSLRAYEEHDAQFLLHLLLRGDRRAHFTQSL
jgi:hypothetical protein